MMLRKLTTMPAGKNWAGFSADGPERQQSEFEATCISCAAKSKAACNPVLPA